MSALGRSRMHASMHSSRWACLASCGCRGGLSANQIVRTIAIFFTRSNPPLGKRKTAGGFCSKYKERERGSLVYQARCVQSKTGGELQSPACHREALLIYRRPPPGHPKSPNLIGGVHDDPTPSGSCSSILSPQLYLANVVFRRLLHSRADNPTRFVRRNCGRRLPGCGDSAG